MTDYYTRAHEARFQSSPSPGAGRCIPGQPDPRDKYFVSILAQPGGRALRGISVAATSKSLFQSSPSPGAGRCKSSFAKTATANSFNPRPARGPGAADLERGLHDTQRVSILAQPGGRALRYRWKNPRGETIVSILAQPGGRALRLFGAAGGAKNRGFNPRPARGPGAADGSKTHPLGASVSILAQPGGRALRWSCSPTPTVIAPVSILAQPGGRALHHDHPPRAILPKTQVSILAQPGGRALPCSTLPAVQHSHKFQSSPSPGAGRCMETV